MTARYCIKVSFSLIGETAALATGSGCWRRGSSAEDDWFRPIVTHGTLSWKKEVYWVTTRLMYSIPYIRPTRHRVMLCEKNTNGFFSCLDHTFPEKKKHTKLNNSRFFVYQAVSVNDKSVFTVVLHSTVYTEKNLGFESLRCCGYQGLREIIPSNTAYTLSYTVCPDTEKVSKITETWVGFSFCSVNRLGKNSTLARFLSIRTFILRRKKFPWTSVWK